MLGPTATPEAIAGLREQIGLDQPLYMQFLIYVPQSAARRSRHILADDAAGLEDLLQRFPATLELVTLALLLAIADRRHRWRRLRPSNRSGWCAHGSPTSTACWPAPCPTSGSRWC